MESLKPYFEIAPDAGAEEVFVMIPADGLNLVTSEAYCTNPACECNEVMLMAITMDESGKSGKPVFSFRLDLSTWKVTAENVIDKEIGARNIIGDLSRAWAMKQKSALPLTGGRRRIMAGSITWITCPKM